MAVIINLCPDCGHEESKHNLGECLALLRARPNSYSGKHNSQYCLCSQGLFPKPQYANVIPLRRNLINEEKRAA